TAADAAAPGLVDGLTPGHDLAGGPGGDERGAAASAQLDAVIEVEPGLGPDPRGQVAAAVGVLRGRRAGDSIADVEEGVPGLAGQRVEVGVEAVVDAERHAFGEPEFAGRGLD